MSFHSRTLEVVRFHRRYYVSHIHTYSAKVPEEATDPKSAGARIVKNIPNDPEKYRKWLDKKRARHAAKEAELEVHIYELYRKDELHAINEFYAKNGIYNRSNDNAIIPWERISDGKPNYEVLGRDEVTLPSELPLLAGYKADNVYIINLDDEILTINHGIHWKLNNIPRRDNLWALAGVDSIYPHKPAISLDLCPEEHMAEQALPLPEHNPVVGYNSRAVVPRTDIDGSRKTFFTYVLARIFVQYKEAIVSFGREWSVNSFPIRELAFAIVSIASGQTMFHPNPPLRCHEQHAGRCDRDSGQSGWDSEESDRGSDQYERECHMEHLYDVPTDNDGWGFGPSHSYPRAGDANWAGDILPLLEFGSMSHFAGQAPGASPSETTYWIKDVLVSLTMVVDGRAITNAVEYGVNQGRTHFQMVVISLFDVAFAEVSLKNGEIVVRFSESLGLSPLRPEYCTSTHPCERPELKPGMAPQPESGEQLMRSNCTGSARRLRKHFPGLAALLNFFDVAADRRVASRSSTTLPAELYDQILDFVDYETWEKCLVVSQALRSSGLRKYRIDAQKRIVAGPFVRLCNEFDLEKRIRVKEPLISFNIEDMETGEVYPVMNTLGSRPHWDRDNVWAPIIGSGDRQAFMFDVLAQFVPGWETPVEDDNEDGDPIE
ncbi:hypothetical protein PG985_007164 [Apiospora marii]|uniref:F-box domain-containing protein n=1 Tax=Apiospora marii TaxID=335849 RepID=A0ABR1SEV2_9PEZI